MQHAAVNLLIAIASISVLTFFTNSSDFDNQTQQDRGDIRSTQFKSPDTTAVVLNWSRLSNVIRITRLLCGETLQDIISQVFIWNNSPQKLTPEIFSKARCSEGKLKIYNSPTNIYFRARFEACAQATTPYCFLQDDDYLIWPEVIVALRSRFSNLRHTSIHLLPPHEVLSSQLSAIVVADCLHTSFAWLGHGAMIKRSQSVDFLSLMRQFKMTDEEMKMADNYFALLSNTIVEVWFDQGFELGGGQPFTVGIEGDERNNKHIIRAMQLLSSIMFQSHCNSSLPYISTAPFATTPSISRSPCLGRACVIETSVNLLPASIFSITAPTADQILALQASRYQKLGHEGRHHYTRFPLSHAVDGRSSTSFRSPKKALKGEWISLDVLKAMEPQTAELIFLVDSATEVILMSCGYATSVDGIIWTTWENNLRCIKIYEEKNLRQCGIQLPQYEARYFRVHLLQDMMEDQKWNLFEMWIQK